MNKYDPLQTEADKATKNTKFGRQSWQEFIVY